MGCELCTGTMNLRLLEGQKILIIGVHVVSVVVVSAGGWRRDDALHAVLGTHR